MPKVPHADEGGICPLHKVDMSLVCHKCPWWTMVRGKNPQSEEMIDDWRCAVALLPMLLVENAQMSRKTGIVMENFRNEVVTGVSQAVGQAMDRAMGPGLGGPQQGRLIDARDNRG